MRVFVLVLVLVFLTTPPAFSQDEAAPLLYLDIGPGFFTSFDEDSTAAEISGVTQYAGLGIYLGDKVSLSGRVFVTREDVKSNVTSIWGYISYYPLANAGNPGPYLAFGGGTDFDGFDFSGKGGYQVKLFSEDILLYAEAEGQVVDEEDVNGLALVNAGMRAQWGSR